MKNTLEILNTAMRSIGPWHGVSGDRRHLAFDVLFVAEQHLRKQVDTRAQEFLLHRKIGSSVAWLIKMGYIE